MSVECRRCGHESWDHGFRRCNRISGIKPCICKGFAPKEEKSMEQPKRCAFCGSADVGVRNGIVALYTRWWIECHACEARGPLTSREDLAVAGWTLRAEVGELLSTKSVLEERVEQLSKGLRGIAQDCAAEYPTIARRARLTLEENNEGDVPSPDGDRPSEAQPGV